MYNIPKYIYIGQRKCCTDKFIHVYIYIYTCICIYIYAYMHIPKYIYICQRKWCRYTSQYTLIYTNPYRTPVVKSVSVVKSGEMTLNESISYACSKVSVSSKVWRNDVERIHLFNFFLCIHYMYIYVYLSLYISMYTSLYIYTHLCICLSIYIHIYRMGRIERSWGVAE
jgi:hypothetical protein